MDELNAKLLANAKSHTARVGGGKESRGEMKSSLGKKSHDFKCNPYLN